MFLRISTALCFSMGEGVVRTPVLTPLDLRMNTRPRTMNSTTRNLYTQWYTLPVLRFLYSEIMILVLEQVQMDARSAV